MHAHGWEDHTSQEPPGPTTPKHPSGGGRRLPETGVCKHSSYAMAARRLFGATRAWAGWGTREILDSTCPGRLLVRDYAKKPSEPE